MMPDDNEELPEAVEQAETAANTIPNAALEMLADTNPDELSPREALDVLYRLKALENE